MSKISVKARALSSMGLKIETHTGTPVEPSVWPGFKKHSSFNFYIMKILYFLSLVLSAVAFLFSVQGSAIQAMQLVLVAIYFLMVARYFKTK